MNSKRIKAFTILEVTITMLIAGLLIGITYTSYSIIIQSYHSFTEKNEDMAVLVTLDHLLKRDFDRAEVITRSTDGITLTKDSSTVVYRFTADFIIRNAAAVDTFRVKSQGLNTAFEHAPLNEIGDSDKQNRVDEIDFVLVFQNEKIPYHYHKLYSSVNLFQANSNAVH